MSKKFLLIDDDQDDKELFCEVLQEIDQHLICYAESNARKALEKLESKKIEKPDVIFLDINMPIMDGWQCLTILKSSEAHKNIPVIMYSTSSEAEDIKKAQRLGAATFFTKPTDFNSLKKSLEVVVDHVEAGSLCALSAGSPLFSGSPS